MPISEDLIVRDNNYVHDGIEVVLFKSPLTQKQWDEILENQKIVSELRKNPSGKDQVILKKLEDYNTVLKNLIQKKTKNDYEKGTNDMLKKVTESIDSFLVLGEKNEEKTSPKGNPQS